MSASRQQSVTHVRRGRAATLASMQRPHRTLILKLVVWGLVIPATLASGLRAQESGPRITIAGSGLVSFNLNANTPVASGTDFASVNDFSDSFLMFRADQLLYNKSRAGVIIGFLFPDARNGLGQVFYNQVQVFYDSRLFSGRLGRTRLSNFVLEFPVLREEDFLEYSFVTNPFSTSPSTALTTANPSSELTRWGNVMRAELYQLSNRVILAGQLENWAVTDSAGALVNDFEVNGVSASLVYRLPEAVRFTGAVRRAGVSLFSRRVDAADQTWMHTIAGGAALNLTKHPLRAVELRAQGIYNLGIASLAAADPLVTLADFRGRARAEYVALVGSIRYLSSPYQLQRFQVAVTGAYKTFPGYGASQFSIAPNVFFRLGQGVDLGLQYQFTQFNGALAEATGMRREQSLKFVLSFRFQLMFNDYFGERDDILNLEHGYIP